MVRYRAFQLTSVSKGTFTIDLQSTQYAADGKMMAEGDGKPVSVQLDQFASQGKGRMVLSGEASALGLAPFQSELVQQVAVGLSAGGRPQTAAQAFVFTVGDGLPKEVLDEPPPR